MSGYLMDTNVVSLFAPGKPTMPQKADAWFTANRADLYIPAFAFHELRRGIAKHDRQGGHTKAQTLLQWLHGLLTTYAASTVPFDAAVAMTAGAMEDAATAAGKHPGLAHIMIAATAKTHSMTLLTANMKHFQPLGIQCLDPMKIT
ncbi:type II toxin-antitoxin system VapC family toxin [Allomesorhizobium alhagi]|uniref:Twitching motility protein PilT n=1 Tax=Mesorhizobium alhagi CCNWXJ12-2 TaxID=1107882 RepID=H0HZG9_9HYPH|nr:type II toxin-antitoxin system VapC family toxin [Mesorhizobium alhagi]EHK53881.1 twitching motility protein PilT [Mesorhizobium alhagi CCNWXJ12-2]